ncbi:hypothetical protein ACIA8E_37470 [Streptomyces sp. NPDC051664]|uniref:hypothetical protein n=1 Tax=Streptomyces sp. NPDC051664 TaxID=3365668 RepID=UPI0037B8A7FE
MNGPIEETQATSGFGRLRSVTHLVSRRSGWWAFAMVFGWHHPAVVVDGVPLYTVHRDRRGGPHPESVGLAVGLVLTG